MVLSTTFNDISVILVEETGESGENHRPAVISSVNDLHFDVWPHNNIFMFEQGYSIIHKSTTLPWRTIVFIDSWIMYSLTENTISVLILHGSRRDHVAVGILTTYAISAYPEFESRSGEVYSIQHYVIKFVSDLRQVGGFLRDSGFLYQ